jgi:hypothetical protein
MAMFTPEMSLSVTKTTTTTIKPLRSIEVNVSILLFREKRY